MIRLNFGGLGLTLTVELGPKGVTQFQEFLSEQQRNHIDAECVFPGYEFVVGHWPPVDFWRWKSDVQANITNSAAIIIQITTINRRNSPK